MQRNPLSASYLRNFVFGVEDSLVSTVGLLSGVAIAGVPRNTIILTGVVLIFVEAFSMGVGSFLSEHSADDYLQDGEAHHARAVKDGFIMFFSYFIAGFIPLAPYGLATVSVAFPLSVVLSVGALFALGALGGKLSGGRLVKNGLRMAVIGGLAIAVGIIVGQLVHAS